MKQQTIEWFYLVYLTMNIKNNKMYIGVHKQNCKEFDGYIGCGIATKDSRRLEHPKTPFHFAVKKYGYKAFVRQTLKVFNNELDAYAFEKYLVDEEWIKRNDVYNVALGGKGGGYHLRIPVLKYSKEGDFIAKFPSVSDAAMYTKKAARTEIAIACKNVGRYTSGGFYWSYEMPSGIIQKIKIKPKYNAKSKAVLQYSIEGNFLREFSSMRKAAKETKANSGEISIACKNWKRKSGNCYWRFKVSDTIPTQIDLSML